MHQVTLGRPFNICDIIFLICQMELMVLSHKAVDSTKETDHVVRAHKMMYKKSLMLFNYFFLNLAKTKTKAKITMFMVK